MNTSESSSVPTEATPDSTRPAAAKPPWSPTAIAWICVLFTMLPAGVMYALNFERLGRPEKKKLALLIVLAASGVYYLVAIRILVAEFESQAPALGVRSWFHFINILAAWRFYLSQQALFALHIQQGGRRAPLLVPALLSLAFMLAITYGPAAYIIQRDAKEFERAALLMDSGGYQEAEAIFKRHKAKYPEDTGASYNLALIYAETDRIPLAEQELRGLLRSEPDNKDARELLREIANL